MKLPPLPGNKGSIENNTAKWEDGVVLEIGWLLVFLLLCGLIVVGLS
jgi:hypothetical protein